MRVALLPRVLGLRQIRIMSEKENQIVVYQPNDTIRLDVRLEDETVWLTQSQMTDLFQRDRTVITRHINNVFEEGELDERSNVHFLHIASSDKPVKVYSLNVIISVGYRVKSLRGTQFRIWATQVLRQYLLQGYAVNQALSSERQDPCQLLYQQKNLPLRDIIFLQHCEINDEFHR